MVRGKRILIKYLPFKLNGIAPAVSESENKADDFLKMLLVVLSHRLVRVFLPVEKQGENGGDQPQQGKQDIVLHITNDVVQYEDI